MSTFTDKQWAATDAADAHRYTLFGGSRGPGKSHWLRWYLILRLLRWGEAGQVGVHVGLFCEDYPSLKDRHLSKLALFPNWLGTLKSTKADGLGFHLDSRFGGGVILLRNLDDPTKYQSVEFAGLAIDELTKDPPQVFDVLRGSLRWPGINDTFFVAASNPNGKYFKWVRQYWVEGNLPENLRELKDQFCFIEALPSSNPYLDASYWQELNTLPTALRDAWRDGNWYVAVQGLVFDEFSMENITDWEPGPGPFEIAIDDGYIDPRATLFIQAGPRHILVFDELYHRKYLEGESIRDILAVCLATQQRVDPDSLGDVPSDQELKEGNINMSEAYTEAGVRFPELAAVSHEAVALRRRLREANIPARNWMSRRAGGGKSTRREAIKITRGLIKDGNSHRAILVHRRCKNLIEELTQGYRNKEDKMGGFLDEPEDGDDHACEALESWVWLRARKWAMMPEDT